MYGDNIGHLSIVNDLKENVRKRSVYLEAGENFGNNSNNNNDNKITKVAPYENRGDPIRAFEDSSSNLFDSLKPIFMLLKVMGLFPIAKEGDVFKTTPQLLAYSVGLFLLVFGYIGYIHWDKVEMVRSAEGKFEEAVIDYLFSVYLIPIIINCICLYEVRKQAKVLTSIMFFERLYYRITRKKFMAFMGNKPYVIAIGLPVLATVTMVITHITMVHFKTLQVIPYCYINAITYVIGGAWFIYCDLIGRTATTVAEDFQNALKNIGPSSRVADYRSLWMILSRIIRDIGNSFGYTMTFLCLYLFMIITLTIYGLLSQIQEGLGIKDIGLTITAFFAGALLFFICDEAHYASNCVRVQFQKKLLLVELAWMNEDAQHEINMFLRATEMNPTDMVLVGFFAVNRNLFKSLIATMVTYLVVLLQFQISIPEDIGANIRNSTKAV